MNRGKQNFKNWIIRIYKTGWYNLNDYTLKEALKEYNRIFKTDFKKFWY